MAAQGKAFGETPACFALRNNTVAATEAVERHLSSLRSHLVQNAFMTGSAFGEIDIPGVPNSRKANDIMRVVEAKVRSGRKSKAGRSWLEEFARILIDIGEYDVAQDMATDYVKSADSGADDYIFFQQLANEKGTHRPGGFEQPDGLPGLRKRTHPEQDLLWKLLCFTDWMRLNDDLKPSKPAKKLFVESKKYLWPKGKRLQVKFCSQIPAWRKDDGSGNCISTDDILAVANEWHQCGVDARVDVVPEFVHYKQGKSDIRVEFSENGGAYSLVGTDAENEVANNHTMCLNLSPNYFPYKFVIRHEFGHALGLQHEHQSPNAPQQFNKEELVKYLKNTYGWNDEQAESQIESQWGKCCESPGQLKSPYDKNSIMHYLIPSNPGVRPADYDGPTEYPVELSETDKKMIVKFYSEDAPAAHPASKKMLHGEPVVHGDEVDTGEITGNEQGATGLQTKMLDKISDVDAEKMSRYINKWEPLAPYLELGESEREEIRREGGYADQKRKLMSLWIEKKGKKATYSAFIDAAREAGKTNLADNVEELLCTKKS